jgi:hypothetical protein
MSTHQVSTADRLPASPSLTGRGSGRRTHDEDRRDGLTVTRAAPPAPWWIDSGGRVAAFIRRLAALPPFGARWRT